MTSPVKPAEPGTPLLRDRAGRVFREIPGSLAGQEEAVHQLRVASRRLRVALALLVRNEGSRRLRRALRVARRLTRAAGRARDLDVLIALFAARLAAVPKPSREQRSLLGRLRIARARSRARLADAVLDLDIDGLRRELRIFQRRGVADVATALLRVAAFREAQATALLRGFSRVGDRNRPVLLHALRRRVRRLRYAAEVEDVLRGESSRASVLWKGLQEAIGVIHDHHLLGSWLDLQARAAAAAGRLELARAARRERRLFLAEGRRLHAAFLALRPADMALRALEAMARGERPRARAEA